MPHQSAIFDTNAYHVFAKEIRSGHIDMTTFLFTEDQNQNKAYASPHVIKELASHLSDEADTHYSACRDSLTVLYYHCIDKESGELRILADSESLIENALYGRARDGCEETLQCLATLVRQIALTPPGSLDEKTISFCCKIANELIITKQGFVDDMREVACNMNPPCPGMKPLKRDKAKRKKLINCIRSKSVRNDIAMLLAEKARSSMGIVRDEVQMQNDAQLVLGNFRLGIELYIATLETMACNEEIDMGQPHRANLILDIYIALSVGGTVGGKPPVLTGDKAIIRASNNEDIRGCVQTFDHYWTSLSAEDLQ